MRLDGRHDPGLDVARRAQVEGHAPGDELGHERRVVDRARSVGDPLRLEGERPADLRRATPFAGVDRDPQTTRPGRVERAVEPQRIGVALLPAGQVPADEALAPEPGGRLGQLDVASPGRATGAPCR